jgi:hypothetical protein
MSSSQNKNLHNLIKKMNKNELNDSKKNSTKKNTKKSNDIDEKKY